MREGIITSWYDLAFAKTAKYLRVSFKGIEQKSDFSILTDITGSSVTAAKIIKHIEGKGVYDMDRVISFWREIDLMSRT